MRKQTRNNAEFEKKNKKNKVCVVFVVVVVCLISYFIYWFLFLNFSMTYFEFKIGVHCVVRET